MKLSEKIYTCRKKAGMSQEELAARLNVSRQAVSKWESGDTSIEISNLKALAKEFNVTVDWLISDNEYESDFSHNDEKFQANKSNQDYQKYNSSDQASWIDRVPGLIGTLFRKYGWVIGLQISLGGLGFTVVGAIGKALTKAMFGGLNEFPGTQFPDMQLPDNFPIFGMTENFATKNPVAIMSSFIMGIGIFLMCGGAVLGVLLYKYGRKNNQG